MKCPKCNSEHCAYDKQRNKKDSRRKFTKPELRRNRNSTKVKRDKLPPRVNFNASCKNCGWKGVI